MTDKKHIGMRAEDKARLLQALQGAKKPLLPTRPLIRTIPAEYTRFESLAAYTQLEVEKAVAKKLGVEQPYYRCHEGLSQERAVIDGKSYSNFSCYDYLGLNGDSRIREAIVAAADQYGFSASASRLTAGERPPHRVLEQSLRDLYGSEDCLVFVSGHATNVSTIAALFGPQDGIFYDQACHNSLVLGACLANAARFAFPNNDMQALRELLATQRGRFQRALIVTEGLFGMDGVVAPLPELIALKKEYSAFLMVDEAHSMGTLGPRGYGLWDYYGLNPADVDIWMGTLSKTFCGCGGYIAGCSALIELLKYQAPGFVYSVGMPPMLAAGSAMALKILRAEPERVAKQQEKCQRMLARARAAGLDVGLAAGYALIPILVGNSLTAVVLSQLLFDEGVLALPIIYPGVQEGRARLRFFVSLRHSDAQIDQAIDLTQSLLPTARRKAEAFAG